MVINHRHRFCYFAIPRTGSQATTKLLVEEFGSEVILKMHMSYDEFQQQATEEEKAYFTFCAVRNPLDSLVSSYFKKKNDHNGRFSRGTFLRTGKSIAERAMNEYRFITENDATFAEYFQHFYTEPYHIPRHESTVSQVDFVMHFERLQIDINLVLEELNLSPSLLPTHNTTQERSSVFLEYYTPAIIPQAVAVTKDIMKAWGYDFPISWRAYL
ncbi:sulfotransferase family 2 domain-containing protein [Lewinella cohaerens]|uniref:sulfotransferase family 2 domain-containing protein n=1 Tax=Lewinella cohaerens TaxID=70995 RepID=UPI00035CE1B4|nr:sulfotransferase family 2 domain-containing protein [Lewinella cohaerens]